ncbi:NADP-dependent phosphogluconate dehydrogenase [Aquimarina pacifica]|uniref:NADP-dependent phosphogluconate dehydrogenase n=1 Tax=Aquimarina pacifica TaxID=1296415 RepID=UPI0004AE5497|nr:NADP-dependent phosphogluconate dehydrogenase [Aquimarina pacifica]
MVPSIIHIIFGVAGSGKTTIGKLLAKELNIPFYDADDFHPEANILKMSNSIPLEDIDRMPWLEKLAENITNWQKGKGAVLACSALKQKYRDILQSGSISKINWIFLDTDERIIQKRLETREGHFFRKELISTQFETLEKPKSGIFIDATQELEQVMSQIKSQLITKKSQLGLIGLGVMGKSLSKNIVSKGFGLSVYNRHVENQEVDVAKTFVEEFEENTNVIGFDDLSSFMNSLEQPRTIVIMVHAGKAIDEVIESILPLLAKGDCVIDGGNSHFKKTIEREQLLLKQGVGFLGVGISGGEEGALKGPSIMPGGTKEAYLRAGVFLEAIAAKDKKDKPCCAYIGPQGAGHFVKMIHNGIEYAEMQTLAEIYHLLRYHCNQDPIQISTIFDSWRRNKKDSFLLEITIDILRKKEGDVFLIDKVLDKAGQKGTGGWSTIAALELGVPLNTISEAVMARNLSGLKSRRVETSLLYNIEKTPVKEEINTFIDILEDAFLVTNIINHAIGFDVIAKASDEYKWDLRMSEIARIWTNGCIIRSNLMEEISELFIENNNTPLLLFPQIVKSLSRGVPALKKVISSAVIANCAMPVMSSAINYFLTHSSAQSSANIIQAQRDYFGAHTYQRVDREITEFFHTNWKTQ